MKISYYEAFDLIAEEAVDLLAENNNLAYLDSFSSETTLESVLDSVGLKKVTSKKVPVKIRFLIAAVIILTLSTISFADEHKGAELITAINRHLVGKEDFVGSEGVTIIDKDGNIIQGSEPKLPDEEIWKKSTVIKRVKESKNTLTPYSISEFKTATNDTISITPEIITWNGDLVIFTKEDGSGWHMKKGQSLVFDVELYPSESYFGKGQYVGFYKIFNGTFYDKAAPDERSNVKHFELYADKTGEYYFGIINFSSDSISFKEGTIQIID